MQLKNRYANCFTMAERQDFDTTFFRISGALVYHIAI
jgi:hypothetical protein